MTRIRLLAIGLLSAVAALLSGCLERKESIKVDSDGRVLMQIEISGDVGDFAGGDALPERQTGWDIHEQREADQDGKEKLTRKAVAEFRRGQDLPDSFADPHWPEYDAALRFPTELKIERRADGTYYHFKRVYAGRANARYQYFQKALQESNEMKALQGKELSELTEQERGQLVNVLRMIECLKQAEYLASAVAEVGEDWPQDHALNLRQSLMDYFAAADGSDVLDLMQQPPSETRDAQINEYGERMIAGARSALRESMAGLKFSGRQIDAVFAAMDAELARRAVTEDLGDERWEVTLRLPGELLAHNGDSVSDDGEISWKFGGEAMMDRDQALMATSRIPHNGRRPSAEQPVGADEEPPAGGDADLDE